MIIAKFRHKYPQGSLVSELIEIEGGTYIVKASVQIDNLILATALAGATTVEAAEDAAKERAIATLYLDHQPDINPNVLPGTEQIAIAPQERQPDPSAELKPGIQSEETSNRTGNHKIVNFSKPQAAPAIEHQESTTEMFPSVNSVAEPRPQPDLPTDLPTAISVAHPAPPTETNLFGDTFTAETPPIKPLTEDIPHSTPTAPISDELGAMDFNDIKQKTDIEIKRLSWTKDQGKDFLMSRYGKRSRLHLTDEQLLEFLRYLETLPNPVK
jgi:hypothetical protein